MVDENAPSFKSPVTGGRAYTLKFYMFFYFCPASKKSYISIFSLKLITASLLSSRPNKTLELPSVFK